MPFERCSSRNSHHHTSPEDRESRRRARSLRGDALGDRGRRWRCPGCRPFPMGWSSGLAGGTWYRDLRKHRQRSISGAIVAVVNRRAPDLCRLRVHGGAGINPCHYRLRGGGGEGGVGGGGGGGGCRWGGGGGLGGAADGEGTLLKFTCTGRGSDSRRDFRHNVGTVGTTAINQAARASLSCGRSTVRVET